MPIPKYAPNQYGTVLVFREGVTEEEIAKAMNGLRNVLENVPAKWSDMVRKFDNRIGYPTWYIP